MLKLKTCAVGLVFTLLAGLAGCSSSNNQSGTAASSPAKANSSATLTCVGSTAMQPMVEKAAQDFMAKNPGAKITVQGGGSGTGLTQVLQGACAIGNSDIYAEEKLKPEDAKALVDYKICVVGFAAVVNRGVKVDSLTKQQLIDVFTGAVRNWKEVGGNDMPITVINRPSSSGTRAAFKRYALDGKEEAQGLGLQDDSSGTVKKTVAETDGAVSYLALPYIDSSLKALKFEGVEANFENIAGGKYPIWSYEHMYTKGEATGMAKQFIDYMLSDEVQKNIVFKLGYIPISSMKVNRDK